MPLSTQGRPGLREDWDGEHHRGRGHLEVCGRGAQELEPDDPGKLSVRVHQLAPDRLLAPRGNVQILLPPPSSPSYPCYRGTANKTQHSLFSILMTFQMFLMMFSCIGLSWVPGKRLRNWLYERVALTVFRCFSRSFSGTFTK